MVLTRSVFILALETVLLLAVLTQMGSQVSAQFGLSQPCDTCLAKQIVAVPTCVGVNLANQAAPEYRVCLCDATFDYSWTNGCSTACQANELATFKSSFANTVQTGLNITCVKPTPSPTTPVVSTPTSAAVQSITQAALLGWAVVISTVMAVLIDL
ncbi:hypothetical protein BGZ95_003554 [Linnemannia exigua]|uniref:Extracellular membrane protein CFEM domain-containing protein n=1 Tax=Linnemannia exigua TaxID=604196 RepID=A0AAD4D671_9FUNG|nr:hypothetical protein BGZ95_003554 [Linnemannia exigua]